MNIPIVQGTAVKVEEEMPTNASPYTPYVATASIQGGEGAEAGGATYDTFRQEPQPKQFQDVFWAVLFVAHLVVMLVVISINMGGMQVAGYDGSSGLIWLVGVCAVFTIGISTLALTFMMRFAESLVKIALMFSVGMSAVIGVMGLMTGQIVMGVLGMVSFAVGICYAYVVWERIPFAAANLNTALVAVKANMGLTVVAYVSLAIAFGWTMLWFLGVGGAVNEQNAGVMFLLFLSYYWVHQVLQNTVHVTTAGTIGTWWFVPDECSSCCSPAIQDSYCRATTYSFGSICLGSLIVAIVQALRSIAHMARNNEELNMLVCVIDCILSCIQELVDYLNKWAYVYVGLYGFGYFEAGRNVIQLFENKGWTVIITDDLADNVLFMISVCIGLITGLIGLILAKLDENLLATFELGDNVGSGGFIIGMIVGFAFSSILMGVVASAVNTIIVCYAESPAEFEANHPQLSSEMRAAWTRAWPGVL